jgi:hypothetical protein
MEIAIWARRRPSLTAFVEDKKERENFTAADGCDVLQAGRPLRLELESTNE